MTISFQLIATPEDEQVNSRQVSLPSSGGTLGRSYECTIQLEDFNKTLSRVHAEIRPHPLGGFQAIDRSTNGLLINGVLLGKGVNQKISDGDRLELGEYTLLVSDIDALFNSNNSNNNNNGHESHQVEEKLSPFNINNLDEGFQDIVLGTHANVVKHKAGHASQTVPDPFSSENILGDDLYGFDPFDEDDNWEEQKTAQPDEVVMVEEDSERTLANAQALTLSDSCYSDELQNSIKRLNAIITQQERNLSSSIDRDKLVVSIEATLERFLDSFNPSQLEEEFDDYITGWGNKEKKYWALYKKQFHRKHERREFYRLFSSILFEELSEKR
ncbi:FHA domain-containing protein [Photobacterium makurazakiensis]|uniref:FHA domain-containing protein n=1 Tax=Photobacterium makurazakiensis TaxID=2910234 RepID=UPI003D0B7FCB